MQTDDYEKKNVCTDKEEEKNCLSCVQNTGTIYMYSELYKASIGSEQ